MPGRLLWYSLAYMYTLAVWSYSSWWARVDTVHNVTASLPPYLKQYRDLSDYLFFEIQKLSHSPIYNHNRSVLVVVATFVYFHKEIKQTRSVAQIRPVWIVQKSNVHFIIVLNWLNGKMLDDIIVLFVIRTWIGSHAITFSFYGFVFVWPELKENLKLREKMLMTYFDQGILVATHHFVYGRQQHNCLDAVIQNHLPKVFNSVRQRMLCDNEISQSSESKQPSCINVISSIHAGLGSQVCPTTL